MLTGQIQVDGPYILGVLAGAGTVIAYMFQQILRAKDDRFKTLLEAKDERFKTLLDAKDAQLEELRGLNKAYLGLADEAYRANLETTNFYRAKYENKPPLIATLPVIPEGSSPPSDGQRDNATLATLRAGMAQVKIATGQEPRQEPGS